MTKEEFAGIFEAAGFTPLITEYEYSEEPMPAIHMMNYHIDACVDLMCKVSQFILYCDGEGYIADYDPVYKAINDYFSNLSIDVGIDDLMYTGMSIKNDSETARFVPFVEYINDGYVRVGIVLALSWAVAQN